MMQAGVPDFDLGTWFGIFAPAHTPENVVQKLHDEYAQALGSPDVRQRLAAMGSDAAPGTPASLAERVRSDLRKYAEIVRISGAKLN